MGTSASGSKLDNDTRWKVITDASVEVGPALFISLLIITLSFIPIFTLEGQEGRLFGPLAFTKTYAMAGAALLAIVVIPILMGYWIRGKIPPESSNPLNRFLIRVYHPLLLKVLHWPKTTLLVAALSILTVIWPLTGRWAVNFCRRSTRAICCICRRRCRGFPQQRRRVCCKKPTS
ncbi:efflux RND transporter permease subunit [Escherichia coli]|nr:efflux RND transporter permease subunit [Escherichia coli]